MRKRHILLYSNVHRNPLGNMGLVSYVSVFDHWDCLFCYEQLANYFND